MGKMMPSQARAFRDRWQAVATVEAEERRNASLALRWRQMNALYGLGVGLGLVSPSPGMQDWTVWERWARLKHHAK
jgi:hypothetical protein